MALITKLNNIATAIGQKTGEPASTYTLDNMPSAIASIQTAWPVVPEPDTTKMVRFIDYNGDIVTQMTLDEAEELTSLPEIPTHEGLTAVGWTQTLEEIKSSETSMDVGAMYRSSIVPPAGKEASSVFKIYPREGQTVTLNFSQTASDGVTVDWGDGSATETVAGAGNVTVSHTYTNVDNDNCPYALTLTPNEGVDLGLGHGTNTKALFNSAQSSTSNLKIDAVLGKCIIQDYTFQYCYGLTSVVISNFVTSIGKHAFSECHTLTSVTIPNSVTGIGNNTFYRCYGLASIVIPNSVTSIGGYAFYECHGLASIVIPNSVIGIENNTFQSCSALTSVVIPGSVTYTMSGAFQNCYSLASIVIPDSVTSIADNTFASCYSLASIVLPNSLTYIGGSAFVYCYGLTSIVIPSSVTRLGGSGAFASCYSLTSIKFEDRATIPGFVSGWAFGNTVNITELDFSEFTQVPTLTNATNFFSGMPAFTTIKVPAALEADWKAASGWSTKASQIVGV